MLSYKKFMNEGAPGKGGAEAGKMELIKIPLKDARAYAEKIIENLDEEIPNFDDNFILAQKMANYGHTKRKNMPVISSNDIREFQERLSKGFIDINKPFSKNTNSKNPFPEGLTGEKAKEWFENGLKDGSKEDDVISVKKTKRIVGELKPIQEQIYFDKSINAIVNKSGGPKGAKTFISGKTFFIISKDGYIIDGHHRYLTAILLDKSMKVNVIEIDLPISKLLPLSLSYGDAAGNKRNK